MSKEFQPNGNGVIRDSRRLEIFFKRNGTAYKYFKNSIKDNNSDEGLKYKEWILERRIPLTKSRIIEAIKKDYFYFDEETYYEKIKRLEIYFNTFENAIKGRVDELDFIRSFPISY